MEATMVGNLCGMTRRELNRVIERHEWFTAARRARALMTGEPDPALTLPLLFWATVPPAGDAASAVIARGDGDEAIRKNTAVEQGVPTHDSLIDRFIERGVSRIAPESEAEEASVDVDIDPEMVTAELAEIYRAQGLTAEAEKIYALLNLRKS